MSPESPLADKVNRYQLDGALVCVNRGDATLATKACLSSPIRLAVSEGAGWGGEGGPPSALREHWAEFVTHRER